MDRIVERDVEEKIKKWIDEKEVLAIVGPRQSGKTTLLLKIKNLLEKRGIIKEKIHFISFEDDFEKDKFEKDVKEYINYHVGDDKTKHFFLLDEIQYVEEAGKLLKLIYDTYPNVKIFITGSSSLDIRGVGSALVGRIIFFELYPFSFAEFLKAKDEKIFLYYKKYLLSLNSLKIKKQELIFLDKLNNYLKEYITYGGYPRVVLEKNIEKKKELLKNLYLTYIEKDIVKIYGSEYKRRIFDLVKYLASVNGSILNYNDICSFTNLYYKELKDLFRILEDSYIIQLIRPFHKNLVSELRKNPKVYFIETGLRNFIVNRFSFSEDEFGILFENYILNLFRGENITYWRTTAKAEVDFILVDSLVPLEVKTNVKFTRSLRSFIKTYKPKKGIIFNFNDFYKKKINNTVVFVVPASLYRT